MSKARPIAHKRLTCCSYCCRQFGFPRLRSQQPAPPPPTPEAGGARTLRNEPFISAPQLSVKRRTPSSPAHSQVSSFLLLRRPVLARGAAQPSVRALSRRGTTSSAQGGIRERW